MNSGEPTIDVRYRTLLTLWFAMAMSQVMWLVLIHFVPSRQPVNPRLGLLLVCLSLVPMSSSFLAKQMLLGKATEARNLMAVQQAYVVGWALCEIAALLGLLAHFLAAYQYYYGGVHYRRRRSPSTFPPEETFAGRFRTRVLI